MVGAIHASVLELGKHKLIVTHGNGIADPFVDDSSTGQGIVLGRAATKLRSIEIQPLTGGSTGHRLVDPRLMLDPARTGLGLQTSSLWVTCWFILEPTDSALICLLKTSLCQEGGGVLLLPYRAFSVPCTSLFLLEEWVYSSGFLILLPIQVFLSRGLTETWCSFLNAFTCLMHHETDESSFSH